MDLHKWIETELKLYAGVDEVGRGPLAGPVVAAAVILNPKDLIHGLADSKTLSEKKREKLSIEIKEKALAWAIAECDEKEIDNINILKASLLAMKKAVLALSIQPEHVLVDGNKTPVLPMPVTAIIQGDSKVAAIGAASIIAKVYRDALMKEYHKTYPEYGFASHKGYPTKQHVAALNEHGACKIHRKSFGPVRALIKIIEEA